MHFCVSMGILFLLSSGVSGVLSYHCYLAFQYLSIFHQSIRYFDNPLDSARSLSIVPRIDLRIEYSHLLISSPQLHLHVWLIFKCECLSKQEGSNQVRSGQKMFPEGQKSWLSSKVSPQSPAAHAHRDFQSRIINHLSSHTRPGKSKKQAWTSTTNSSPS